MSSSHVKILVNATTITVGGGVQAIVSFIEYAAKLGDAGPVFLFTVSEAVYEVLSPSLRADPRVRRYRGSPAHRLKGRRFRRELLTLEAQFAPGVVYSIGFPSYVVFTTPEASRYTNGWEICCFPAASSVLPWS